SNVPWYSKSSKIKSATIGNGVTSIGRYAFYSCIGLTSVTIPDSITSIGNSAFYGCTGLTSVTIPDGVTSIGEDAFFYCTGLTSVTIPDSVTSIGERAFFSCEGLTSVTIPDGVTSIGNQAFSYCTGLISITIPDSVTSIGDYAFYGCTNLEKIEISAYSVEIADNAFDNSPKVILYCKSGSTVQSYAELNDIMYILIDGPASGFAVKNNQLVAYKGESENPQLPSGVTSIGSNAFKDNGTVKTVELPNSVSSIFSGAFSNCSSLERIVVPHTVTTIAPDAFNGTNATIVCYANSYAHQYAVEKGMNFELISITLNQTKVILSVGEYSIITATPEQEYLDSVQTSWKSSDTGVATVDANGKVTALSNGTATIYALAPTGETLATCSVQVGYSFRITIQNPSTKTISYKSGIILHATADNLPAGAKIVWEKDNDNFSMSDDGNGNCKIISKANGSTTFTVKVKLADGSIAKDSNGNEMSAQVTMNSKAGFFDKIVAFFKGLFGGNKVLPQLFKGIF
ncbi:MAG: leucine-rich repeat protein, partial [Oscillospiraceae bacterium]|nr:leucine-rich repeat protein [Oscillospiraceae bacterium]